MKIEVNQKNVEKDKDKRGDVKKDKKPFKLTIVTKEELEKRRISVYPYVL